VRLSALYLADPVAALRRLKSSNEEAARAAAIVEGPPAPAGHADADVRRWLARVGRAADDLLAMHRLRHGDDAPWAEVVRRIRERGDPVSRAQLAVGGHDLQALGLRGPRIGEVLETLLDRVLDDPALNTRARLLALAGEIT
jgi:hypothetical protein